MATKNNKKDSVSFLVNSGLLIEITSDGVATYLGADFREEPRLESRYEFQPSGFDMEREPEEIVVNFLRSSEDGDTDFTGQVEFEHFHTRMAREAIRETLGRCDLYNLNVRIAKNQKVCDEARKQAKQAAILYSAYSEFWKGFEEVLAETIEVHDREFVAEEVRRFFIEQPELFVPDRQLRADLRDVLKDGNGVYRAMKAREEPFKSGDDMVHIMEGVAPEEGYDTEKHPRVPYVYMGSYDPIYMAPRLEGGQWVQRSRRCISVYFQFEGGQPVLWNRVYAKFSQQREQLIRLMQRAQASGNWSAYNYFCMSQHLPTKGALKSFSEKLTNLREAVSYLAKEAAESTGAEWTVHREHMPIKGYYLTCDHVLEGKPCKVIVRLLDN